MRNFAAIMGRIATTLDEQIALLQSRGMIIDDIEKAKEVLLDVGYYRLGFYWFPFEKTYPRKQNRTHEFKASTHFEDAVRLYYFDYKLRSILLFYITRIEINLRNFITYTLSNCHGNNPWWFADKRCVDDKFISSFDQSVYNASFKLNSVIRLHHRHYPNDQYAPAWKTTEYMTFGSVINLYKALTDRQQKIKIARHYGIRYIEILENYLEVVRELRNYCAHGNVLYDFVPFKYIRRGPANINLVADYRNLKGSIEVVSYLLRHVSANRDEDMREEINFLMKKYSKYPNVIQTVKNISGLDV